MTLGLYMVLEGGIMKQISGPYVNVTCLRPYVSWRQETYLYGLADLEPVSESKVCG
jgi:hypothetical protein